MCSSLSVLRCVGEGSLFVLALEGSPFIASCQGLNLCLGVGWVFTGCVGKNVCMQGRGGCDVLVCHRTIEFRLRYALFIVENVHTSHFELVMYLSYYCSHKS